MEGADFSGYATMANIECSDGRTIMPDAFKHMDGQRVPLVWQHIHNDVNNVLGHAIFEARKEGLYAYGFFNKTPAGLAAKELVHNKDVDSLSIYANKLVERAKQVFHGMIRELSLVIAGANGKAKIDNVNIAHGDDDDPDNYTTLPEDVIIHMALPLDFVSSHKENDPTPEPEVELEDDKDAAVAEHAEIEKTFKEVFDTFNKEQEELFHFAIAAALETNKGEDDAAHADDNTDEGDLAHTEGTEDMTITKNLFDQSQKTEAEKNGYNVSQTDVEGIFRHAQKNGSFRDAIKHFIDVKGDELRHGEELAHGVTDLDLLFPDARSMSSTPEFDKRRTEWVAGVLDSVHRTPFANIKTLAADLTQEEARAKGYIKGEYKKQEWIGITKRVTRPTTVYKKQQVDRDDVLDVTDFDLVVWLLGEMRLMLEEELARAILIGDGRDVSHEDKIKDPEGAADAPGIRSIYHDHEYFVTTLRANVSLPGANYDTVVDVVMDGMEYWKGTGQPTLYTTVRKLNRFKKAKDGEGRRLYKNNAEVAEALGVDKIVTVEVMNTIAGLIGIIVNLNDYNLGTNKGGELTNFDDFDIDYNTYKYLLETRLSGALLRPKSALIIMETTDDLVEATVPTFVDTTGVVTIPTVTGLVYKNYDTDATLSAGAQSALAAGASIRIHAVASTGYYTEDSVNDGPWTFKRPAA